VIIVDAQFIETSAETCEQHSTHTVQHTRTVTEVGLSVVTILELT